jgi:hypothetical protein
MLRLRLGAERPQVGVKEGAYPTGDSLVVLFRAGGVFISRRVFLPDVGGRPDAEVLTPKLSNKPRLLLRFHLLCPTAVSFKFTVQALPHYGEKSIFWNTFF